MNNMTSKIPVGYMTKNALDACKNDVVKDIGRIVKVRYVGEHEFNDLRFNIIYKSQCVEFETKSALTGRKIYTVLPFEAEIEILQYSEDINYQFDSIEKILKTTYIDNKSIIK